MVLGAGSDVSSMETTARLEGDCWILNGSKSWVSSGIEAESAVIFATIDKTLGHKGITGLKQKAIEKNVLKFILLIILQDF